MSENDFECLASSGVNFHVIHMSTNYREYSDSPALPLIDLMRVAFVLVIGEPPLQTMDF